jgi:hypothetical protein
MNPIVKALLEDEDDDAINQGDLMPDAKEPQKKYLEIGSISHGTMQSRHLIHRFLAVLDTVDPEKREKIESEYTEGLVQMQEAGVDQAEIDEYQEDFCWNDLSNALGEHTPPYTYFGANEGDGSDYGVWISSESIEETLGYEDTDDLIAVEHGEEVSYPTHAEYVIIRNGRGDYEALLDGNTGKVIWRI